MNASRRFIPLLAVGILLTVIILSCAEVAPPPGGEPDKTSPFILGSNPANGAVEVALGRRVQIQFSERIVRPEGNDAIFISPRPDTDPDIDWNADNVVITLADSFAVNQTYLITLSPEVTDLRRNKIDSMITIAFTTGPSLASGEIGGMVLENSKPQSGFSVALFNPKRVMTDFTYDSLYPDYLTSTNKEGMFQFRYLPEIVYRLIAFKDVNRDQRFNPARESFAVPDRLIRVGRSAGLKDLKLVVSKQDTGSAEILSVTYTADRLLRLRLARPLELNYLQESPNRLEVLLPGDSSQYSAASSLLEMSLDKSSTLNFYVPAIEAGKYDLRLTYDPDQPPLIYEGFTVEFAPDKRPPVLLGVEPKNQAYFTNEVEIVAEFSEPLDTNRLTDETFLLLRNDSTKVPLRRDWQDVFHLQLVPDTIEEGSRYKLAITEFDVFDRADNVLGDSLQNFYFSTLAADSLGSVRGTVTTTIEGEENTPIVLTLEQIGGNKRKFDAKVTGHLFNIQVPAGKYLLSGFLDRDHNGRHSPGSVIPFKYAETVDNYPDTIAVRARFETSGLSFTID